jgi:hypothetical protein
MPKKTAAEWLERSWIALIVPAGSSESVEIPIDPSREDVVVKGQIYDAAGETQIKGFEKPHFHVVESNTGASLVFSLPTDQDLLFLYKIVSDDDDIASS